MSAADLLRHLRMSGLTISVDGDRLMVSPSSNLTTPDRENIRAHRGELLRLLTATPRPDDPALIARTRESGADWTPVDGEVMKARVVAITRRGFRVDQAEELAEYLMLRDHDGDDRRMCVECSHLGDGGRCLAAARGRLLGAARWLEPVPTILHRCEAFGLRKGLV